MMPAPGGGNEAALPACLRRRRPSQPLYPDTGPLFMKTDLPGLVAVAPQAPDGAWGGRSRMAPSLPGLAPVAARRAGQVTPNR